MFEDIKKKLESVGYFANDKTAAAVNVMLFTGKPLLVEGAPGVGKTYLAQSVAKMLNLPLVRLQMYEGLTDEKVLYDYNYQKQLLTLEAIKPKLDKEYEGASVNDMIKSVSNEMDFYGKEFLIERPVLSTINGSGKKVFLIDEIDKAPEEIEYMLYEYLENYSISIPQYGDIICPEDQRPIVFLTSNNYREISDALKRRCNYLYIDKKTDDELVSILLTATNVDPEMAKKIALAAITLEEKNNVKKLPSLSELITWADFISKYTDNDGKIDNEMFVSLICKDGRDEKKIREVINSVF